METIGFIGLGNLGSPFAVNIQKAGYPMVVHDTREAATKPLLDGGAGLGASPEEVARLCEVIFTSLPGPKEVEEVAIGPRGLLEGIQPDAVYIDLSASRPALIRRIEPLFREKGADVLDAPVEVGPHTAARKQGTILPSGDRNVFERILPILESFIKRVVYTGRLGNGSICKLVGNMTQVTLNQMLAEMLTLGVKAGVELPVLMEASGRGMSMVSENVTCIARDDNRWLLFDPISLHGRAQSFHVLLCRVPMDAEFPGDPSSRQPPALRLLNSVPPCRLEWSGLPALHGRCLADSDGAVVDGRVVSIAGVHLCVECCQGRLPAPAQTVEVGTWGCPV